MKSFITKNKGKDTTIGRPIELNKAKLVPKKGKDYAELIFFGDLHYGHPQCQIEDAQRMLDYALANRIYVFCMGDMIEAGLSTSVGDSVYMQDLNPQKQMEFIVELLRPLAEAGLIVGYLSGNHEERIVKTTSIDISKMISRILKIPYLGYSGWTILSVDGIRYSIYCTHGSGGSRFKHTKLKKVIDMTAWISSDIVAMGHVHSIASEVIIKQEYDRTVNKIVEKRQYVCLTGSYLGWNKTYAEAQGYPPAKNGSPKAKLSAVEKDVHFSL